MGHSQVYYGKRRYVAAVTDQSARESMARRFGFDRVPPADIEVDDNTDTSNFERFTSNEFGYKYLDTISTIIGLKEDNKFKVEYTESFLSEEGFEEDIEYIQKYYSDELKDHLEKILESPKVSTQPLLKESTDISTNKGVVKENEIFDQLKRLDSKAVIEKPTVVNSEAYQRISVEDGCIACGICLEFSSLFRENIDGTVMVNGVGIVNDLDIPSVQKLIENCPAHVIRLKASNKKSRQEIEKLIFDELEKYSLSIPERSEFEFSKDIIRVSIPWSSNERQYIYASDNKAKRAGLEEFNRIMFSQRENIIQQIFIEYKANKLLPYSRYEKISNNFYYKIEQQISDLLEKVSAEVKTLSPHIKIPNDFVDFTLKFNPKEADIVGYFKAGLEILQAKRVLGYLSGECYSLSSYEIYFDTDDSEEYAGTGLFGNDKYITKYCFYNLKEAFETLATDITAGCQAEASEVVEEAYEMLKYFWGEAEKDIKQQLLLKASQLKQAIKLAETCV